MGSLAVLRRSCKLSQPKAVNQLGRGESTFPPVIIGDKACRPVLDLFEAIDFPLQVRVPDNRRIFQARSDQCQVCQFLEASWRALEVSLYETKHSSALFGNVSYMSVKCQIFRKCDAQIWVCTNIMQKMVI